MSEWFNKNWLPYRKIGLLAITVGLAGAAWTSLFSSSSRPPLIVPASIELGMVQPDEQRTLRAFVKNVSAEEITIQQIRTSCSCVSAFVDGSRTIGSGKEVAVTGTVNFGLAEGKGEVTIFLKCTNKQNRVIELGIPVRGIVAAPLVLEKTMVDFGALESSAGSRKSVIQIEPGHSGEKWDSIDFEYDHNNLAVAVQPSEERGRRVSITLDPLKLPISQFRQTVKLHLVGNGKELSYVPTLTVTARIKGKMRASPQSMYLGALAPRATIERFVEVESDELDLTTLAIEEESSAIETRPTESSKTFARIRVRFTAPEKEGSFCERIRVFHKESGTALFVPFVGVVR